MGPQKNSEPWKKRPMLCLLLCQELKVPAGGQTTRGKEKPIKVQKQTRRSQLLSLDVWMGAEAMTCRYTSKGQEVPTVSIREQLHKMELRGSHEVCWLCHPNPPAPGGTWDLPGPARAPERDVPAHSATSWLREAFPAQTPTFYSPLPLSPPTPLLSSPLLCPGSMLFFWASNTQQIWFVLSRGIAIYTQCETSRLDGEQMFLPIKIYMKTINVPLTNEISRNLWEIVKSSPLGNSAGVMHDPVATVLAIFLSKLKHNLGREKQAPCKWHIEPISLAMFLTLGNSLLGLRNCIAKIPSS